MLNKKISVVVPCYNEEGNIEELARRMREVLLRNVRDYELIFADNKSTDRTREILRNLARNDPHIIALFFARNFGHSQYGFTAGSDYATGDAVIWTDADLQDPPEIIEEFIKKWREGYNVVYGVREKRRSGLFLRIAYKFFYRLYKKMSYLDIPLDAGDFSLMDRKVIDVINAMPERDRYVRGLRTWAGFRAIGVPYVREERHEGKTSNNIRKNIWWAKKAIFSFSYTPLEFIFYLSLVVFIISVTAVIGYLIAYFVNPGPRGFTTILMVTLFLGSSQLLALSIIAEYIGRIFEEVKGRPKYIIEEIVRSERSAAPMPPQKV